MSTATAQRVSPFAGLQQWLKSKVSELPEEVLQKCNMVSKRTPEEHLRAWQQRNEWSNKKHLREIQQHKLDCMLKGAGVPMRYRQASVLQQPPHNDFQAGVWNMAKGFINTIDNGRGLGFLLLGGVGVGKTHLICAIANDLIKAEKTIVYTTCVEVIEGAKNSWNNSGELSYFDAMTQPDLLILDEIGIQTDTAYSAKVITTIVDRRHRECKPTIAASNLNEDDVIKALGQRAFDRITASGEHMYQLSGQSLRGELG